MYINIDNIAVCVQNCIAVECKKNASCNNQINKNRNKGGLHNGTVDTTALAEKEDSE